VTDIPQANLPFQHEPVRAAYVHWPYCIRKCDYCDFVSWVGSSDEMAAYARQVTCEIHSMSNWSQLRGLSAPLTSIFLGGGTPSLASPSQLAQILNALRSGFGIDKDAEITLEANPGTLDLAKLQALREAGFNRISLGLQAAQGRLLRALGRIHTVDDFVASVQAARLAGFQRINADLMLGLPGQTLADLRASLDLVLGLDIGHVSFYGLIIEPGTAFEGRYGNHPEWLPDEDLERSMYHDARARLDQAGLVPYEISNAARKDEACRHNRVYWQGEPYYGFGVAAHSFVGGIRRGNTDDGRHYSRIWTPNADGSCAEQTQTAPAIRDPFGSVVSQEVIDGPEAQREMFLLGLRLSEGVRWQDFLARFGCDARSVFGPELADLSRRGLILQDESGVRLSLLGLDLANQAFAAFVR
jgi:oxygen-independent coproporphyrinogen-3 oxidase